MLLNFVKLAGWILSGIAISWVEIFIWVEIFQVEIILTENFPGRNSRGGIFPG